MSEWIVFGFALWGLYELLTKIAKNFGDTYYQAAMNEQYGSTVIKQPRIYMLSGTYSGCCGDIVETLKCIGCRST
jgi:hypothetical protein